MHRPFVFIVAILGLLATPPRASAQTIAGWSLGARAEAGVFSPFRSLGKNASGLVDRPNLQTTADLEATTLVGGALMAVSPSGTESLKLGFQTTVGGTVSGGLSICGDDDDPLFVGELCEPVEASAELRNISAILSFLRGTPGSFVRPEFHVGVGFRQYTFGERDCTDPGGWQEVCEFTRDIWDGTDGWSPYGTAGAGFRRQQGPLTLFVDGYVVAGRFPGGVEGADNALQTDLLFTGGVSFSFR